MRINKYIASAGIASRRKADELVEQGKVKINGLVLKELGYEVVEGDVVEVNGKRISNSEKLEYYLLHKPLGFVTTVSDEDGRPTVVDCMTEVTARVFPVGRLDYNTSGALIMTNDGDLTYRLTHPKHGIYKTYRALVKGELSKEKVAKLRHGVDIGGYVTQPAIVNIVKGDTHSTVVEISITEGKNRQVRKMFSAVGNPVQELERISIGNIRLGRLKYGTYRKLTKEEIDYLKSL